MAGLGLESGLIDLVGMSGRLITMHGPKICGSGPCPVHNPSDHPLRDAPMEWVPQLSLIFRVCGCFAIHPDPDSEEYIRRRFRGEQTAWHECCELRCCQPQL